MASQHIVQFYGAHEDGLIRDVARYTAAGLDAGDAVLLVTFPQRRDAIFRELDTLREREPGGDDGRLIAIDSENALSRLFVDGSLNPDRFYHIVGSAVRELASASRSHRLRVYGDMVDTLWRHGNRDGAIELERYWNDLQAQIPFDLYCAYDIDVFGEEFDAATVTPILHQHAQVLSENERELRSALDYAMYETLGGSYPVMHDLEGTILWVRSNVPKQASGIFHRARQYATDSI
jgi:MEDS: MEthanogen/methylotroph, DcmR Sensory domain